MNQLQSIIEKNCFIHPMMPISKDKKTMSRFTGGVFNYNDEFIKSTLLIRTRNSDHQVLFINKPRTKKTQNRLKGRYIFGGYFFHHYGHFILESLSRMWFAKQYPDLPILFAGKQSTILDFQNKILELIGVKNKIEFIPSVTMVDELDIPEPGAIINCLFSKQQANALGVLNNDSEDNKKIWISRSNTRQNSKTRLKEEMPAIIKNEKKLEDLLKHRGWVIFDPLNFDIIDQLKIIGSASHLAGFEGSAFHSLLMFKEYKAKIDIFSRTIRPVPAIYKNIFSAKGIDFKQHEMEKNLFHENSVCEIVNRLESSENS
jgi:capsular polysaccharide biosynthesis protein